MSSYFIVHRDDLTTTPSLIAEAVDVDREVLIQEIPGEGHTEIRFAETGDRWGVAPSPSDELEDFRFILPAGAGLWARISAEWNGQGAVHGD